VTLYNSIYNKGKNDGILWGWKRTFPSQSGLARKNNLTLLREIYFDKTNEVIFPKKLYIPLSSEAAWQAGIYINEKD
jgi:hypothetical protein